MIDVVSPYESFYQVTNQPYELRPVRKKDLQAIEYLLRISGMREDVKTIDDWGVVAKILEFYSRQWPEEWSDYVLQVKDIRSSRARKDGYSREKGKEGVRYLATLPGGHFPKLFKIIFPKQQWDREFTEKFVRNIQISRVGEKIDTWFTIPSAPTHRRDIISEEVSKIKQENGVSGKQRRKRSRV